MKTLSILGSTGSIGESTLRVVERFPDRFRVAAIAGGRRVERLAEQARRHKVGLVACETDEGREYLARELGPSVAVMSGIEGLMSVATHDEADMLVSALVGALGLKPTYAALKKGRDVAVANKETLVVAGEAVMAEARRSGARVLPVDSEHSALFQVLDGKNPESVKRVILTASGGPFLGRDPANLRNVPPAEALKHPNWSMGPKISIDSATMMNKGLEVIEARWLFDLQAEKIDVAIHPMSIVHSLVEFIDGSIIAQMGVPDMRGPIGYALSYPERLPMEGELDLDLWNAGPLTFAPPDMEAFPCLRLAYETLKAGGTAPAALSAANEVAVKAYLDGRICFGEIAELVSEALQNHETRPARDIEEALDADRRAREYAAYLIEGRKR